MNQLIVATSLPLLAMTANVVSGQASLTATHDSVSIAAPGGGFIHGDLYGAGTRGVVLIAHGGYSYKARWEPQARALAAAGFRVLAFDTRAGETLRVTGKETECLSNAVCMAVDVLAAVRYLRNDILEGSAHGQLMFDAPEGERVMREILSFLRER